MKKIMYSFAIAAIILSIFAIIATSMVLIKQSHVKMQAPKNLVLIKK